MCVNITSNRSVSYTRIRTMTYVRECGFMLPHIFGLSHTFLTFESSYIHKYVVYLNIDHIWAFELSYTYKYVAYLKY